MMKRDSLAHIVRVLPLATSRGTSSDSFLITAQRTVKEVEMCKHTESMLEDEAGEKEEDSRNDELKQHLAGGERCTTESRR